MERKQGVQALALVLLILCTWKATGQHNERIWLKATVNGKPVNLFLDTGATDLVLFPRAAERLGLAVTAVTNVHRPVDIGEVPFKETEECELSVAGGDPSKVSLSVLDEDPAMAALWDADGVLGWYHLRINTFRINARLGTVEWLRQTPEEAASWTQLKLRTNSNILRLELPEKSKRPSVLFVDTGSEHGVSLPPEKWRGWKAAHKNQPTTLDEYYTPSSGLVVAEESWARELSFGSFALTDVPVIEARAAEVTIGTKGFVGDDAKYEGTLGLAALQRLDVVIDGKGGIAYLRPSTNSPLAYDHNRMAAVFTPRAPNADDLVAHVLDSGPAYEAGIRNGDILLKVGQLDATKWRTDPAVMPLSQFWMRPSGSKVELTLKRGDGTYKTIVVLREILSPQTDAQAKTQ